MSTNDIGPVKRLTCACCGESCRGRQWWNRDTGYGICTKCIAWMRRRGTDEDELRELYGDAGIHWGVDSEELHKILGEALNA